MNSYTMFGSMEWLFHYDMVQNSSGKQSFGWLSAQNVEWGFQVRSKNCRIAIQGRRGIEMDSATVHEEINSVFESTFPLKDSAKIIDKLNQFIQFDSHSVKALNEIKASLGWRVVYAWIGNDPCGDGDLPHWSGVTCSTQRHCRVVTELEVYAVSIVGPFPIAVTNLLDLTNGCLGD
ncbi:hypothetical protein J1N35_043568 [Gossypium stocksii]|uniref:Leucine-rich repeat-containing N-terminal plant-type domain-containing protein n=1 Tax=Gossypium stocksii TaxID=47602 RepID=A0A9D3U7I3_9ROSI|nr:hypothetical protein J1N35_043568 [Gossypium stocksii]